MSLSFLLFNILFIFLSFYLSRFSFYINTSDLPCVNSCSSHLADNFFIPKLSMMYPLWWYHYSFSNFSYFSCWSFKIICNSAIISEGGHILADHYASHLLSSLNQIYLATVKYGVDSPSIFWKSAWISFASIPFFFRKYFISASTFFLPQKINIQEKQQIGVHATALHLEQ